MTKDDDESDWDLAGEQIRQTAKHLLDEALDGLAGFKYQASDAIAALLLAAGTAAAWGKVPYKDLIDLISLYYEKQLLREAEVELLRAQAGNDLALLRKPAGSN